MDDAEEKAERFSLQCTYSLCFDEFSHTYEDLSHYEATAPRANVEQENLTRLGHAIAKNALEIQKLLEDGALTANSLESWIYRIRTLQRGVISNIKRSLSNAKPTLTETLKECGNEFTLALLDLINYAFTETLSRSPDDGNKVYSLVNRVVEAYVSLSETPTTNATAVGRALAKLATDVEDALDELRELKWRYSNSMAESSGISSGNGGATTSKTNERGTSASSETVDKEDSKEKEGAGKEVYNEKEKAIADLAVQVMADTLPAIRELICCIVAWGDTETEIDLLYMEVILKWWTKIRDCIIELKRRLFPLRDVHGIRTALSDMAISVNVTDLALFGLHRRSDDFVYAINLLKSSIRILADLTGSFLQLEATGVIFY